MRIFVGNLSFSATNDDVRKVFEAYGAVESVAIRKKSGQNSRGFGFVTMPNEVEAEAAIAALEGKEFMGRPMNVTQERIKAPKPKVQRNEETPADEIVRMFPKDEKIEAAKKAPIKEFKSARKSRASGDWEKRKGRGAGKPWKKKPGGIKKKFKTSR